MCPLEQTAQFCLSFSRCVWLQRDIFFPVETNRDSWKNGKTQLSAEVAKSGDYFV